MPHLSMRKSLKAAQAFENIATPYDIMRLLVFCTANIVIIPTILSVFC